MFSNGYNSIIILFVFSIVYTFHLLSSFLKTVFDIILSDMTEKSRAIGSSMLTKTALYAYE